MRMGEYKITGIPEDELKRYLQQDEAFQTRSATFYRLKPGNNKVRLIPPLPGKPPFVRSGTHFGVGVSNLTFQCPAAVDRNAYCPVCATVNQWKASGDDELYELAQKMEVRIRYLYNIVDLEHPEQGIQIAQFPSSVHNRLYRLFSDEEYGTRLFDVEAGHDLAISREGDGLQTRYDVRPRPRLTPVPEEIRALLQVEYPPDLSTFVTPSTKEEMEAALSTLPFFRKADDESDDDFSEDGEFYFVSKGSVTKSDNKRSSLAAALDAVEEDDGSDESWDWTYEDEEEEEPLPVRPTPRGKGRPPTGTR
jgi:hypothetical protein